MSDTYYKLAQYVERFCTFRDGKTAYPSEDLAKAAARKMGPGKYRVSAVTPEGRYDCEPFEVAPALPTNVEAFHAQIMNILKPGKVYPKHATRPMGGRPH